MGIKEIRDAFEGTSREVERRAPDFAAVDAKIREQLGETGAFMFTFALGVLVGKVGPDEADRLVCQTIACLEQTRNEG